MGRDPPRPEADPTNGSHREGDQADDLPSPAPPPPSADFDLFGATPFDGGDLLFDLLGDGTVGLDWGFDSGDSGEFLMGSNGSIPAYPAPGSAQGLCTIEPGDNTLAGGDPTSGVRFAIYKNGGDTGSGWSILQGATGSFVLGGPTPVVTYVIGDRISIRPVLFGAIPPTMGYIRAPRFGGLLEDTP